MANTFLFSAGKAVGASLCERDMADAALEIAGKALDAGCELLLPTDAVVATEFKEGAEAHTIDVNSVPEDGLMLDVGLASVALLKDRMSASRTVVWNGPLGAFEVAPFDAGTNTLARHAAALTRDGTALTVAGGGDTVAALARAGVLDAFSYVSTAGGAFLEWLEGKDLPGVAALRR